MTNRPPLVVTADAFPEGLLCAECDVELTVGMPYSELLLAMHEDGIPIVEIVCVECGMKGVVTE